MVFNRFWRADPARARSSGGTGLGLAISLEDAQLHGGWLQVWGAPAAGAQFRLTLPARAGDPLEHSPLPLVPEDADTGPGTGSDTGRDTGRDTGPGTDANRHPRPSPGADRDSGNDSGRDSAGTPEIGGVR
jgi:two-component system sensor histidine kinase MtrB